MIKVVQNFRPPNRQKSTNFQKINVFWNSQILIFMNMLRFWRFFEGLWGNFQKIAEIRACHL